MGEPGVSPLRIHLRFGVTALRGVQEPPWGLVGGGGVTYPITCVPPGQLQPNPLPPLPGHPLASVGYWAAQLVAPVV